jgi:ParB family chromosome partitioning protein
MDEISDRMTEISEILEAPEEGDDVAALEAEYEALDQEHDRLSDTEWLIPEEDKPHVGTFLVLGNDGTPRLLETFYTIAKPTRRGNSASAPSGESEAVADEPVADTSLPRSLEEQMAKDRRDVLALHIAHDPALALDLAIFALARDHAGHFCFSDTGCLIKTGDRMEPMGLSGIPANPALGGVNRRANGTPDRRRKGTPLRHDDTIKPGARFALVVA